MKLIADSGSSKTAWAILNNQEVVNEFQTSGINPLFANKEDIYNELMPFLEDYRGKITQVYFFGAGIIDNTRKQFIEDALTSVLGNVSYKINSDMLGAAIAVCGKSAGVVCILGTGSNCCYFDGEKLKENIPPLGFILGDEGSGAVLGKQLIGDCFKGIMPKTLSEELIKEYELTKESVIERVYRTEKPNMYLAQFVKFIAKHKEHEYCKELLNKHFSMFIERNVLQLETSLTKPVHFVGSLAHYFKKELTACVNEKSLSLGSIIQNPIEGLIHYYKEHND